MSRPYLVATTAAPLPRVRAGTTAPLSPLSRNIETLVVDAYANGEAQGERLGYITGWRWGVVCGGFAGAMLGALATVALRLAA